MAFAAQCVCVSGLWRRSFIGVCSGGVCVSDLWHRSYIGVCRGGAGVSDESVQQERQESVSSQRAPQGCQVRVSHKSVT